MKTLNLYITKHLLIIFGVTIGILTFVMVGGNILQAVKHLVAGVPINDFLRVIVYFFPMVLSFTVPWAILVAVLLLFGRMSANNEITAMRACGISIFQIISPLIILTFILTVICLYLQAEAGPYYIGKARRTLENIATTAPQALISPGQATSIGNMVIYVKDKKNNEIKDIQIFAFNNNKTKVLQDITSAEGLIKADKDKGLLTIVLYDYNVIDYAANDRLYGKELSITVDVAQSINRKAITMRENHMTFSELVGIIALYSQLGLDTTLYEIQLNLRLAMGVSPIAFLLLGLPLAIRTSRKETSVGLFLSVVLAGIYFFFIIFCKTLSTSPQLHPQLLLWIPNVLYQAGGLFFIFRITKK